MHEIKIVEKVHIKNLEKNSAQLDEGFRSYGHLKPQILILSKILMILVNMQFW